MGDEEERFCFTQQLDKAQLRCKEARALPIDVLLLNTDWRRCAGESYILEDMSLALQAVDQLDRLDCVAPLSIFDQLVAEYFTCILRMKDAGFKAQSVGQEVADYLESKSYEQLKELMPSVRHKQGTGDVEFWTSMERQIAARMTVLKFEAAFTSLLSRRRLLCTKCVPVTRSTMHVDNVKPAAPPDPWDAALQRFTPRRESIRLSPLDAPGQELALPRHAAFLIMNTKWTRRNERRHDAANPPPQICQGLQVIVDMRLQPSHVTPTYKLARSGSKDSVLTIYSAAYSPLSFRVPAAQWDCSPRQGFVFSFEQGILRLRVRFKKLF